MPVSVRVELFDSMTGEVLASCSAWPVPVNLLTRDGRDRTGDQNRYEAVVGDLGAKAYHMAFGERVRG